MIGRDCRRNRVSTSGFKNIIAAGWPNNTEQGEPGQHQQADDFKVSTALPVITRGNPSISPRWRFHASIEVPHLDCVTHYPASSVLPIKYAV
jgi:hypothetical protein